MRSLNELQLFKVTYTILPKYMKAKHISYSENRDTMTRIYILSRELGHQGIKNIVLVVAKDANDAELVYRSLSRKIPNRCKIITNKIEPIAIDSENLNGGTTR